MRRFAGNGSNTDQFIIVLACSFPGICIGLVDVVVAYPRVGCIRWRLGRPKRIWYLQIPCANYAACAIVRNQLIERKV